MGYLKTVSVKNKKTGNVTNINEDEFDSALHEKLEDPKDEAAAKLLDRVLDVSTLEELLHVEKLVAETPGEERDPDLMNALFDKRRQLTEGPRRSQVRTVADHGEETVYEPYLAPASHNRMVAKDQGDGGVRVQGTLETATEEDLSTLEQLIAERRDRLKANAEAKGDDGDSGFDITDVTVVEARAHIEKAAADELDALEKAEKAGPKRVGVLDAIDKRRETLDTK